MSRTDRGTKKSRGIARKALACMTSFVLAVGLMPSVALAAGEDATTPQEVKEGSAEYNSVKVDEDAMGTSQDALRVSLTSGGQVAVKVSGDVEGTKGQHGVLYALSVYEDAGESSVSVDVGGHVQATKTNNTQGATAYAVNAQSWQGSVDVGIKGAVTATSEHGNALGVNAFSNSAGSLRVSVGSASATGASGVATGIYAQNDGNASLVASVVGLVSAEGEKAYGIYALSASSNLSSVTAGSVTVKGTAESAGARAIVSDASARLSVASEGDVTATATGEGGTSAGAHLEFRKPGSVDLFVGGTLKGETAGVAVEENGSSFDAATSSITAWKVEAGEGGYVAAKKTSDGYFEDDTLAKAINYIVKIKDDNGTLAISKLDPAGSGAMYDYEYPSDVPWYSQSSEITKAVIGNGVTSIGKWAFYGCACLKSVEIPEGVRTVGMGAFEHCTRLSTIYYGGSKSQWGGVTLGDNWADNPSAITINYSKWDVTASAKPATGGKVEGADIYANGAMAKLKAIPYEGYEFVNWTKGGTVVSDEAVWEFEATADRTLVANFALKKYKVTFVDADDTVLKAATEYDYGTSAADIEKPSDPTKKADARYTYTFAGWSPEIADVTADATYTATYDKTLNKYDVTFIDDDGTLIDKSTVEHGKAPTHADPAKKADEKYTYEFTGWTPEIVAATGDATYKATYKAVEKYPCAEGSSQTWTKGSGDPLTLRFKGANDDKATFDLFKGVEVDGKAVPEKDSSGNVNWTASKGSLILSLQPSFLEALTDGDHTVKALFEDGAGEVSFTIAAKAAPAPTPAADTTRPASSDTAKTGDTLPVTPVIATLLLSVCALVISKRKLQMVHPAYRGKHVR